MLARRPPSPVDSAPTAGIVSAAAIVSGTDELAAPALRGALPPELARLIDLAEREPGTAEALFREMTPARMLEMILGSSDPVDLAVYREPAFAAAFGAALEEGFVRDPDGYARDTLLAMRRWPFEPEDAGGALLWTHGAAILEALLAAARAPRTARGSPRARKQGRALSAPARSSVSARSRAARRAVSSARCGGAPAQRPESWLHASDAAPPTQPSPPPIAAPAVPPAVPPAAAPASTPPTAPRPIVGAPATVPPAIPPATAPTVPPIAPPAVAPACTLPFPAFTIRPKSNPPATSSSCAGSIPSNVVGNGMTFESRVVVVVVVVSIAIVVMVVCSWVVLLLMQTLCAAAVPARLATQLRVSQGPAPAPRPAACPRR